MDETRTRLLRIRELRRKARASQQAARDAEEVAKKDWQDLHIALLDLEDELRLDELEVPKQKG